MSSVCWWYMQHSSVTSTLQNIFRGTAIRLFNYIISRRPMPSIQTMALINNFNIFPVMRQFIQMQTLSVSNNLASSIICLPGKMYISVKILLLMDKELPMAITVVQYVISKNRSITSIINCWAMNQRSR